MESTNEKLKSKNQGAKSSSFGRQLRHQRVQRGWSQAELAHQLANDAKTIGRWERGESFPTPYYRYKLLELFEKNAEEMGLIERDSSEISEEYSSTRSPKSYSTPFASPTVIDMITTVRKKLEQVEVENQMGVQEINQAEQKDDQEQQMALLELEKQRLAIERERLDLLERRLEVQKRGVEYVLEVAKKVIDILQPNANEATRAILVQTLLPNFLQFLAGKELELTLPEQQNREETV
jgi:DNA-binding XRE family transcriptional regulator